MCARDEGLGGQRERGDDCTKGLPDDSRGDAGGKGVGTWRDGKVGLIVDAG